MQVWILGFGALKERNQNKESLKKNVCYISYKIIFDIATRKHWGCILAAEKKIDDNFLVQASYVQKTKPKPNTYLIRRKLFFYWEEKNKILFVYLFIYHFIYSLSQFLLALVENI